MSGRDWVGGENHSPKYTETMDVGVTGGPFVDFHQNSLKCEHEHCSAENFTSEVVEQCRCGKEWILDSARSGRCGNAN